MNPFYPFYRLTHWPDAKAYQHEQRQWMLKRVLRHAAVSRLPVRRVVEIGCGDGWVCHQLAKHFPHVVGFDINPNRIQPPHTAGVLLVAGSAESPPIAAHCADLIVSIAVLEHVSDRVATLAGLKQLLAPGGRMIHMVPTTNWKWLQWLGFVPDALRKEVRGLSRAMAGVRRIKQPKYYQGRECNNPQFISRRRWYRKFVPRVHGAYDSNLDEFRRWTPHSWRRQAEQAGLIVEQVIALGAASPYGFGLSRPLGRLAALPALATNIAMVLRTDDPLPNSPVS
jgi:SAM-dependent methyltransferase